MEEPIQWGPHMLVEAIPAPLEAPPFTQTNTYNLYRISKLGTGSDISQQFKVVFQNKNGSFSVSPWSLIISNQWKLDSAESNISLTTLFDKYIENGVLLEYQNTAGNVYMSPTYISLPRGSLPSVTMTAFLGSLIMSPYEICLAYQPGMYNTFRPSNYSVEIGVGMVSNAISNYVGAGLFVSANISAFYNLQANAVWFIEVWRKNAMTQQEMVSSFQTLGVGYFVMLNDLMVSLQGFTYDLRIKVYSQNNVLLYTYPDLNISSYIGMILYSSRISGLQAKCPAISQSATSQGIALQLGGLYTSSKEIQQVNSSSSTNFMKIKAVCTSLNDFQPSIKKYMTIWQNFDFPTGYFAYAKGKELNQLVTEILFETGQTGELSTQFNPVYLTSVMGGSFNKLQFNVFAMEEQVAVVQEQFTAVNSTGTDLSLLIQGSLANPNIWVSYSSYSYDVTPTYNASTSSINIQLYAYYDTNPIPPPPPPPPPPQPTVESNSGFDQLVEDEIIESLQEPVKEFGPEIRYLVPKYTPSDQFREKYKFEGSAAKELYTLLFNINPDALLTSNTVGDVVDQIINRGNKDQLKTNWLFGSRSNLQRLQDLRGKKVDKFFSPDYYSPPGETFPSFNYTEPTPQMTVRDILNNAGIDNRYYTLLNINRNILPRSIAHYNMFYDPFNATRDPYKESFGWFGLAKSAMPPVPDLAQDRDLNEIVEVDPDMLELLQDKSKANSRDWLWNDDFVIPERQQVALPKIGSHLPSLQSLIYVDFSQVYQEMLWFTIPFLIPRAFAAVKQVFNRPQNQLALYYPQESIWTKAGRFIVQIQALKFLMDQTGMSSIISSLTRRYLQGPKLIETAYNTVTGDDLTATQKVLITALEDQFVDDFGRYVEYGALVTKLIFPDSKFIFTPEQVVLITRIGSLAGVITNPAVQIGAIGTAAYYFYRKAEQTQVAVENKVNEQSKIFVQDITDFAKRTAEQEQRKFFESQVFLKQLQQSFENALKEQQQKGDQTLDSLNAALGYLPEFAKQQEHAIFDKIQDLFAQQEEDMSKTSDAISKFIQDNQDYIKLASLLGIFAGFGTTAYLFNKHYQEQKRQQEREDAEREEQKRQRRKEERANKKKQDELRNLEIMKERERKRQEVQRRERIREFTRLTEKAYQDYQAKLSVVNQTSSYSYQNQSFTDRIPFQDKISIYGTCVIGNETRGGTQDETIHLTNSSLANTTDGRIQFIHAFANLIENMPTMFDTYDSIQTSIVFSSIDAYLKQSMYYQKLANNIHAFTTYKVFKSIINPQTSQEEYIQDQLRRFAKIHREVDPKKAVSAEKKEKIEEVQQICSRKDKIFELIERLTQSQTGSHGKAFNGAQIVLQRMQNLGYMPRKFLKKRPEDRFKKAITKTKAFNFIQNNPQRLGRIKRRKEESDFIYQNAARRLK